MRTIVIRYRHFTALPPLLLSLASGAQAAPRSGPRGDKCAAIFNQASSQDSNSQTAAKSQDTKAKRTKVESPTNVILFDLKPYTMALQLTNAGAEKYPSTLPKKQLRIEVQDDENLPRRQLAPFKIRSLVRGMLETPAPLLSDSETERVLFVPKSYLVWATEDDFSQYFRQLVMGRELHPQVAEARAAGTHMIGSGSASNGFQLQVPVGSTNQYRSASSGGGPSLSSNPYDTSSNGSRSYRPVNHGFRAQLMSPQLPTPKVNRAQSEGVRAAVRAQELGHRRFLYVAPPAAQKSTFLIKTISRRISMATQKLHIVVTPTPDKSAESTNSALVSEIKSKLNVSAQVIDIAEIKAEDQLDEIISRSKDSRPPIVLVASITSLEKALVQLQAKRRSFDDLHDILSTLAFHEAPVGDVSSDEEKAENIAEILLHTPRSKAFLLGTASASMQKLRKEDQLFKETAYWAYLDTPEEYFSTLAKWMKPQLQRKPKDVLKQLVNAINEGDLVPVRNVVPIDVKALGRPDGNQNRFADDHLVRLYYQKIAPLLGKQRRVLISVANADEADSLGEFLWEHAKMDAAILHSLHLQEVRDAIEQKLKENRIKVLITTKDLAEDKRSLPFDTVIDLNPASNLKNLIEDLGRLLQVAEGKESVDFALAYNPNYDTNNEIADFLKLVSRRELSGALHDSEVKLDKPFALSPEPGSAPVVVSVPVSAPVSVSVAAPVQTAPVNKPAERPVIVKFERAGSRSESTSESDSGSDLGFNSKRVVRPRRVKKASYIEAVRWVRKQGIENQEAWDQLAESPDWPPEIPKNPAEEYQGKGWSSWKSFLGTTKTQKARASAEQPVDSADKALAQPTSQASRWVSIEDARQWALSEGIDDVMKWQKRQSKPNWPKNIPKTPEIAYQGLGWKDWKSFFLGK